MGSPSAPKAPKPPPAPTQTRRQAQRELDASLRSNKLFSNSDFFNNPAFGNSQIAAGLFGLPDTLQSNLDARPDSDFLAPVEQRDFQSLDAQIRGGTNIDPKTRKVRNRDQTQSLLDLIAEGVNSPTIL